ncbi:outer membrane protein assembly factor BamB family protein [Kitasatospora sp. NPDC001175]|uniref:outer membrane protein assembly factor BamB family protein n=1 Tax=Kitasatospora sp. NPDC001175 TaxID=3157103 RepID=UPI003D08DD5B
MGKKLPEEPGEPVGEIMLDLEPGMEPSLEVLAGSPVREDEPEPYRGGLTRRQLLLGAGALALVGGVWWLNDGAPAAPVKSADPTAPAVPPGSRPLWVHRGVAASKVDRIPGSAVLPLFVADDELLVLDPATGAERRRIDLSEGEPTPTPGEPSPPPGLNPPMVVGERIFDARSGRIRSFHLTDPAADWQLPCPPELGDPGTVRLQDCVDGVLYGMAWQRRRVDGTALFGLSSDTGRTLWSHRLPQGTWYERFFPIAGGRLLAYGGQGELSLLKSGDTSRSWSVQTGADAYLAGLGPEHVYTSSQLGGVQAIRLADGGAAWTITPEQGDSWRYLGAAPADGDILLLRDDGRIDRHDPADGKRKWSARVPFRLDPRSDPLLVGDTLYVPGPADLGVCALDVRTGQLRWQFRDSGPGVQVWHLGTDGSRLFAGHDAQLFGLPL